MLLKLDFLFILISILLLLLPLVLAYDAGNSIIKAYEHEIIRQHQQNIVKSPYQTKQLEEQQQQIVESPANAIARLGDRVIFKCKFKELKGEPQWCIDDFCLGITKDLTLKGRPRHRIVGDQKNGEYNLQIDSIQLQDNMFYYCMATAASEIVKAVKSTKASLTVITYPQMLHMDSPVHLSLNKPSVIQCIAYRSRPPVRILVSIDGQLITDESKYTIELNEIPIKNYAQDELNGIKKNLQFIDQIKHYYYNTIVNVTIDDIHMNLQGKSVECNAYEMLITENPYKIKYLKEISKTKSIMNTRSIIQVDYAPEINLKMVSVNDQLKENDVVSLTCSTKATPPVHSYKWYIGKDHLDGANSDTLNLKLRKEMNLETVSCEATNTVASVRASLQLNINYKPYFLKGLQTYLLIDKQSCNRPFTLDCQLDSNPPANITWFKVNYNQLDNKFNKIQIGYGPVYTSTALNCGTIKIFNFNETVEGSNLASQTINDDLDSYYRNYNQFDDVNTDFGLYTCEANNGFIENNKLAIVQRIIKLNPVSIPVSRLVISTNDIQEAESFFNDETTTLTYMRKYLPSDITITLTCIVEPLPEYKGLVWLREDNRYLFNTKFLAKNSDLDSTGNDDDTVDVDEMIDENYENYLLQEQEQDDYYLKNLSYKVTNENTKDGLKSYLQIKLTNKNDFGLYKCKTWNKYGSREVGIMIREDKYNKSLKNSLFLFKFYDKYPIFFIIGFCLLATIIILLISLLFICIFRRENTKTNEKHSFRLFNLCKRKQKAKNPYSTTSAIGIGCNSSSDSSTNGVCANGIHSTSSSHMSSGFNENNSDSKTIDEWLAATSKLSNATVTTTLSTNNQQNLPSHCLVVSYNENNSKNHHESELLLQKSTPITVLKNYNAKDASMNHNKNKNINNDDDDDEDDDSDISLNKLLSDTTYRLSDLFKDLSPNLINNDRNTINTLSRYKTNNNNLNRYSSNNNNNNINSPKATTTTTISTTNSSTSITTVTTNLSNATMTTQSTPSKLHSITKSPRLKQQSQLQNGTSTFLSAIPAPPLPPPPPPPSSSTFYQTTIHSNMKNIPYTTLSKVYSNNNAFYRSKNNQNNDENDSNNDSFNEYSKLNELNNKNENQFQTIV